MRVITGTKSHHDTVKSRYDQPDAAADNPPHHVAPTTADITLPRCLQQPVLPAAPNQAAPTLAPSTGSNPTVVLGCGHDPIFFDSRQLSKDLGGRSSYLSKQESGSEEYHRYVSE